VRRVAGGMRCGGKTAPTTTKPRIEWVRDWVRVIAALDYAIDKVEKPSLDGIRHHDPDRPHQSLLANQLSRCGYSLPTLLETKPPFS